MAVIQTVKWATTNNHAWQQLGVTLKKLSTAFMFTPKTNSVPINTSFISNSGKVVLKFIKIHCDLCAVI